jgi:L-gulonolactone oxidase
MPLSLENVHVVNWASTYSARPRSFYEPASVDEVSSVVRAAAAAGRVIKVVGGAHSPNDCAMSDDVMMTLRRMNRVLEVDASSRLVKVEAGILLHDLHEVLDRHGLAMPNLGSISEQSVAGCIATGTHGTGADQGIIATHIVELQIVLADGSVRVVSRDTSPLLFTAALCGLGCLGVVAGAVIRAARAFDLHAVENPDTLDAVLQDLPARVRSAPYYRFWWFPHTGGVWEWRGTPVEPKAHRPKAPASGFGPSALVQAVKNAWSWTWDMGFGFHALQAALWVGVWVPGLVPLVNRVWRRVLFSKPKERVDRSDKVFNINCLFKQWVCGKGKGGSRSGEAFQSRHRLGACVPRTTLPFLAPTSSPPSPHLHLSPFPFPSRRHVDEWAIPSAVLPQALLALRDAIASNNYKAHFPIEVRFVAGDDIPLSPAYGRPTAYIGVIAYKPYGVESEYKNFFLKFEKIMASFDGRPHWAKDFHFRGDADFARAYPQWAAFKSLRAQLDPRGVFANAWVRRTLGLPSPGGPEDVPAAPTAPLSSASSGAGSMPPLPVVFDADAHATAQPSAAVAKGDQSMGVGTVHVLAGDEESAGKRKVTFLSA